MGMSDAAYWLSWGLWEVTLAFFVAHSICIYGLILQFDLFLHNSYGLLFFLFFLFQLAMSSLALLLSAFISRTQVCLSSVCVFIVFCFTPYLAGPHSGPGPASQPQWKHLRNTLPKRDNGCEGPIW